MVTFHNNPYLGYKAQVRLSICDGKVWYKTNFDGDMIRHLNGYIENRPNNVGDYESFFLCPLLSTKDFAEFAIATDNWKNSYGNVCIDGYSWQLKLEYLDGSTKEMEGYNDKPDDFNIFVSRFEQLIRKPLSITDLP